MIRCGDTVSGKTVLVLRCQHCQRGMVMVLEAGMMVPVEALHVDCKHTSPLEGNVLAALDANLDFCPRYTLEEILGGDYV